MANTTLVHQENRLTFPSDSLLHLRVLEARVDELPSRSGGTWEKLNVKFQIQQVLAIGSAPPDAVPHFANWVGESMYGSVPFYLTDKDDNQLRLWLEALFEIRPGESLPVGYEFDTNHILGRYCKGVTGQYQSNKTDAQGNKFPRHEVKSLLPAGGLAVPQLPQQAPAQWGTPPQEAQQGWAQPQQTAPPAQPPVQQWGQQATAPPQQQFQGVPATQQQMDPWSTPVTDQQAMANLQQGGLWTPPGQQPQGPPQQAQAGQQNPQAPPVPAPAADPWAGTDDWQQPDF